MYSKEAMMEFIEPGSGIPLDLMLDALAKACNVTKRACFCITRNVRTSQWKVTFTAANKSFSNESLRKAVNEAGEWFAKSRYEKDGIYYIDRQS